MLSIVEKIYFTFCFVFLFTTPVYAYIDPSVATYAFQAIAGVAVAAGAVGGIMIRKFKRVLNEKLGIDENANKEVDPDIEVYYK